MRSRSLLVLALAGAPAMALAQDAVLLRVGGQPGQSIRYQAVMDMYMSGGPMAQMGGDTTQPMTRMTMFQTRTLSAITGDTLTFTEVVDSARSEMPAMPQMAAMAGQMGAMMRGMTTTTKMDRRARIFDVQMTGGPMAAMGGGAGGRGGPGGGRGGMMGGGGGGSGARNMLFILPEGRVRPGDSWSDSTRIVGQDGQPNGTFRATFRLERVERGQAVVSLTGSADIPTEGQMSTMNTTGEFRLDVAQGRLSAMNMTMSGTVQSRMGPTPMRMVMSMQQAQ